MDECESLDSEMTELQECGASETFSQDDEDEVEELQNSLREVVQDQSVKPKLQCLMVDPSFSMVTVQSEDSGIVWETASSRCSTPWASETSSISEGYSMDGSGAAGKITIVFDEEKIVRRRTRSGGRSSRLGDRLSRPGSSRSASALGVERLEMVEVSLPNVKQEQTGTEPDLEELKSKDQQLFSLISEGYEILNIRVPSKLPTVDEEESTELQDNLSYLDQTPQIRSRSHHDWTQAQNHVLPEETEDADEISKQDSAQPSGDSKLEETPTPKESGDIDYFEKFTLVDEVVPGEQTAELQDEAAEPAKPEEEQKDVKEAGAERSPSASEDSFVFVSDVEIVGEHLDEVFYGEGAPADAEQQKDEAGTRIRRQSSVKESGSALFGSEETVLTPIFISPGPPKIIDPILLEEPTAMSFMYTDLYEDAVGERKRSDEECSEAESVTSEKSFKRCFTDTEEADGYLEMFILKDETPSVDAQPDSVGNEREGRMMWSQSKFEMTGCLTRAVQEEEVEKTKKEEVKTQKEIILDTNEALQSVVFEDKDKHVTEIDGETKTHLSTVTETVDITSEESAQGSKVMEMKSDEGVKPDFSKGQTEAPESITDEQIPEVQQVDDKEEKIEDCEEHQRIQLSTETEITSEESAQESKLTEKSDKEVKHDIKKDQTEAPETITDEPIPEVQQVDDKEEKIEDCEEHQREEPEETPCEQSKTETEEPSQKVVEITDEEFVKAADETTDKAPVSSEVPQVDTESEILTETTEKSSSAEVDTDIKTVAPGDKVNEERIPVVEASEPQTEKQEILTEPSGVTEMTAQTSSDEEKHEVISESVPPVEVSTDCESAVHAVVEVIEKTVPEKEIQTQVRIDLQEVTSVETKDLQPETEKEPENETEAETKLTNKTKADDLLSEETKADSGEKQPEILEPEHHQEDQSEEGEAKVKPPTEIQEMVSVGDELIVLVPKGQAVEMDIEINQRSEKIPKPDEVADSEPVSPCEHLITPQDSTAQSGPLQETKTETETELQPEGKTVVAEKEEVQLSNDFDMMDLPPESVVEADIEEQKMEQPAADGPEETVEELEYEIISKQDTGEMPEPETQIDAEESLPESAQDKEMTMELEAEVEVEEKVLDEAQNEELIKVGYETIDAEPVEEPDTEEQKTERDLEEEETVFSPLRSFSPLEDLSGLNREDIQSGAAEEVISKLEDTQEKDVIKEEEEVEQNIEEEGLEVTAEELEYEIISKQDAREMPEPEAQREAEEPRSESVQEEQTTREAEEKVLDEEFIEADYETIDAEEETQARLAAELQGMDWFCVTCGCLLLEDDCGSEEHHNHEINAVDSVYEDTMEKLSNMISELQGRSENIEDMVSELELAYNTVEDQFTETEAAMQAQNEEMMALVMEQYNSMSVSMEEEKKAKLEQLYDQIVSFQESIDSAKATLETTAREAETDARSPEDIRTRLKAALDSAMSLELGPRGLLVFEDYAKGNTASSHLAQRKGIPVPQKPTLQPQEPSSATCTSVTVYWKVNPEDVIDCFQVYCMEDPQGTVSEEYRVTVKESYCVLEELEPDKTYKVWVMAVNYTGCSLPSERLIFRTAPSVPVIDTERCTVLWDSATLRWSSAEQTSEQSYTLEYCRQYELEGEGLRSISGIKTLEQRVLLQPNENYLFYIKAVNEAGASEQSEAALISTKGTRFHLLKASAHPALELSVDQTTLHYHQDTYENTPTTDKPCPSILGELLPVNGQYYWETIVSGSTAYRLGVSYSTARDRPLGESSLSWCLQCVPAPSGYQLLHGEAQSSLFVIEVPERVGVLLDYQLSRLSFYNAQSGQLLGTFNQRFTQPCHPALALEMPGSLEVCMVQEMPEFTKDS
ncbi:cardiomyopathy-associated protein 5 isoform X2 [Sphaeramia orbicularis]|uniref:cardiomyopathy-associated protein 5 isoform X2 n=1 Tax=Sphaeramia orbicularis TaxID=375764 RepID=UPI00117D9BDC|nr:cardiomyopathy-associated protein 5-like isoform X2 [Sphaeramia orbicularis]